MSSGCCVECRAAGPACAGSGDVPDCSVGEAGTASGLPAAIVANPVGALENLLLALDACCPLVSGKDGARPSPGRGPITANELRTAAREAARALARMKETRLRG